MVAELRLRPDSRDDAVFVEQLAERLAIPVISERRVVRGGRLRETAFPPHN